MKAANRGPSSGDEVRTGGKNQVTKEAECQAEADVTLQEIMSGVKQE